MPAAIRRSMRRMAVRHFAGTSRLSQRLDRPLRVAHVTDQHVGLATPHRAQLAAVAHVNTMRPDLVVLTGDYVAHSLKHLEALEDILVRIKAPMIGVLGNHDHWSGADEVRASLRKVGVEVLDNAVTTVTLHGQRLQVLGLDDAHTGHADVRTAVRSLDPRLPTLGLSHIGEEADELWEHGVSLVLSGHTHSGQVSYGGLNRVTVGAVNRARYVHGLYGCREGDRFPGAVYVSAGIGAAVVGVRLGERAKREVAVFELGVNPAHMRDREHHAEQDALPEDRAELARVELRRLKQRWQESMQGVAI
jgi:predicted MPP superfamily phosphohydrolase